MGGGWGEWGPHERSGWIWWGLGGGRESAGGPSRSSAVSNHSTKRKEMDVVMGVGLRNDKGSTKTCGQTLVNGLLF